jgi:hypothetical protein
LLIHHGSSSGYSVSAERTSAIGHGSRPEF